MEPSDVKPPATKVIGRKVAHTPSERSDDEKVATMDSEVQEVKGSTASGEEVGGGSGKGRSNFYVRFRPYILTALALAILGWWISATILEATRHRWFVQTFWAWSFILIVAFRFIPNRVVTRPVGAIWKPVVSVPFFSLPYRVRLAVGWLVLSGAILGSTFGFRLDGNTTYGDRAISILGLFVFQFGFWATSMHRSHVPWPTVIVGLFIQQVIAMFALKSSAGFEVFTWIANLASDMLAQGLHGSVFFFDAQTVAEKNWVFVNLLPSIVFFIALVEMVYYFGAMQWLVKHFAWFFFKVMNVSGAEAVVATASPLVGQGQSACLVRPYVDLMTKSELHLIMTSGFATVAGSVLGAYISFGAPPQNLITACVMSIPGSIAISKVRCPELDEPVTRERVTVDRGDKDKKAVNAVHAFSQGSVFGLIVVGQVIANALTAVSLVAAINGLMTWVGKGFGIEKLALELILGYVLYPLAFFMGVPRSEILRVSELLATKLIQNELIAYAALHSIQQSSNPLSQRAFNITTYALCGFANLSSLGIQIGVLSALAPSKAKMIAKIAVSAMLCGFVSTLQAATIAGMLM